MIFTDRCEVNFTLPAAVFSQRATILEAAPRRWVQGVCGTVQYSLSLIFQVMFGIRDSGKQQMGIGVDRMIEKLVGR